MDHSVVVPEGLITKEENPQKERRREMKGNGVRGELI